jgi:hypothetical protein
MRMFNKLKEKVEGIAKSIKDKFSGLLGIHSPSRVFAEFGVNITKGLTIGMDAGAPAVQRGAESLALQTISSYSEGGGNIIPASQVFNSSSMYGGSPALNYNITINGSASDSDKQDFARMLRAHYRDIVDIMRREDARKERLSFY